MSNLWLVAPVLTLLTLLVLARSSEPTLAGRIAVGATRFGALVVGLTEALSAFGEISSIALRTAWAIIGFCSTIALVWARSAGRSLPEARHERDRAFNPAIAVVVVVATATLVVGVASAPNNWDSHGYHLARVEHWLQNASLAPYPTNIERQIDAPPWAEIGLLQIRALTQSDRMTFVVQWLAMVGSLLIVGGIARKLGAGRAGRTIAVVFAATIPMGILQSSSTQNDYVAAFWMVALVYLIVTQRGSERLPASRAVSIGLATGLALLTKGTTYLLALPFLVWWCTAGLARRGPRAALPEFAAASAAALLLNLPHYARNLEASGTPFGPGYVEWDGQRVSYANEEISVAGTVSNAVRGAALHLGLPAFDHLTGIKTLDEPIARLAALVPIDLTSAQRDQPVRRATIALLSALGIDADDPRFSWNHRPFRIVDVGWNFEDTAGAPLHVLLGVGCALAVLWCGSRTARAYLACLVVAYLLFCTFFAWQVYHARLHLPLMILSAALVGLVAEGWLRPVRGLLLIVLAISAVPYLINNQTRPLFGSRSVLTTDRIDQYFFLYPALEPQFVEAAGRIASGECKVVDLVVANDAWEYPLWALLRARGIEPTIRHVDVVNYTARLQEPRAAGRACARVEVTMGWVRVAMIGQLPRG